MTRPIYDYVYIDVDFDTARKAMVAPPADWLPAPARPQGGTFIVDLHDGDAATVEAAVSVGQPRFETPDHRFVQPVSWEAAEHPGLYPRMEANVELSSLSHDTTQITFAGSYRLPAGAVGEVIDRITGHRIAETVVRDFLMRLGARLTERSAAPAP